MSLIRTSWRTITRISLRRVPISALPFNPQTPHISNSEELEEYAASYALEALDADERAEFREHISLCGVCETLVAEFADTADAISESLEPVDATSGLKQRVISAAVSNPPGTAAQPADRTPDQGKAWLSSLFTKPHYQAIAAAVAVIVIGGLVAWNLALQTDNSQPTFASAEFLYDLEGTDAAPGASGAVYRAGENVGFLLLQDLPPAGPGNVYQAWRIIGSDAFPEDTFTVSNRGSALVSLKLDVLDADTIAINIEPEGGSTAPTSAVLLVKAS